MGKRRVIVQRLYDKECREACERNTNMLVPWYLMAAYAYYEEDDPILEDATFDWMATEMLKQYFFLEHRHLDLITQEDLKAGSLLTREWPGMVKGAVSHLRAN